MRIQYKTTIIKEHAEGIMISEHELTTSLS